MRTSSDWMEPLAHWVGTVGGATLDQVRAYVEAQGTEAHAKKSEAKGKAKPSA